MSWRITTPQRPDHIYYAEELHATTETDTLTHLTGEKDHHTRPEVEARHVTILTPAGTPLTTGSVPEVTLDARELSIRWVGGTP